MDQETLSPRNPRLTLSEYYCSTNTHMKTIGLLVIAAIVVTSQINAAALENEFVRKPGQYSLDGKGSMLTITKKPAGSWSLEATWRSGDATSSAAPDNCLLADGWFVFVEKPNRIWIFDGVDGGTLLSHSEKELSDSSFSREVMASCPQAVWDALPQKVRAKYRKVEPDGPANGSQPSRSETNRTSSAAGSRR